MQGEERLLPVQPPPPGAWRTSAFNSPCGVPCARILGRCRGHLRTYRRGAAGGGCRKKKIPRRTNTARRGEKRESSFSREQLALDKLAPHLPVRRESTIGFVGLFLSVLLSSPGGDPAGRAIFPRGQCSRIGRRLHRQTRQSASGQAGRTGRGPRATRTAARCGPPGTPRARSRGSVAALRQP